MRIAPPSLPPHHSGLDFSAQIHVPMLFSDKKYIGVQSHYIDLASYKFSYCSYQYETRYLL